MPVAPAKTKKNRPSNPASPETRSGVLMGAVTRPRWRWRGYLTMRAKPSPVRLLRRLWRAIQRHYGYAWSASIRPANHALWRLNCPQLKPLRTLLKRTGLSLPRWRLGTLHRMRPTPLQGYWRPSAVPLRPVNLRPA